MTTQGSLWGLTCGHNRNLKDSNTCDHNRNLEDSIVGWKYCVPGAWEWLWFRHGVFRRLHFRLVVFTPKHVLLSQLPPTNTSRPRDRKPSASWLHLTSKSTYFMGVSLNMTQCYGIGIQHNRPSALTLYLSEWLIGLLSRSWQFCSHIATGTRFTKVNGLTNKVVFVGGVHVLDPSCARPTCGQSL